LATRNIGEFESILQEFDFLRIHRSQIVNLNKIIKYIKGRPAMVVLKDKSEVAVSNANKEALLDFLGIL